MLLLIFVVIATCYVFSVEAQTATEQEVKIHQKIGSRYIRCFLAENKIYDKDGLEKLVADEKCSIVNILKVDFSKQTLIGYRMGGDCFMRGDAQVFLNETTKTYKVRLINYWGGCRAGGSFVGWLVIDKIPEDYKVEFSKLNAEDILGKKNNSLFDFLTSEKVGTTILESREIDLKGCIQTIYNKQFVIKDEATYLQTIRDDASRERCLKEVEKIDFSKNSLLGIEINSGYCRRPIGLEFQVLKDEKTKEYLLNIDYTDPRGSICRAVSQYDLWVLVPKISDGFEVKFKTQPK